MTTGTVLTLIEKYSTDFLLKILSVAKTNNHSKVIDAVSKELAKRGQ